MQKSRVLPVAAASLLTAASSALAAGIWVPANVPSGGSNFIVFGINNSDVVVGNYNDSSGNIQGVFGPFDGSDWNNITDNGPTQPRGIGPTGIITGLDIGTPYQWERSAKGKLKHITRGGNDVVGGGVQGVNKSGFFVGDYSNSIGIGIAAIGKKYKYTGVIKLKGYAGRAIDDAGDVGGWYYDSSGIQHGFVKLARQKKPVKIDYPNAYYTVVEGMNNKGTVSGQWEDVGGIIHGFFYNINRKTYTSLDAPGASFTQVWGLNDDGVVAVSAAENTGIESFAYCMSSKGCPGAGTTFGRNHQHPSGRAVPQAN